TMANRRRIWIRIAFAVGGVVLACMIVFVYHFGRSDWADGILFTGDDPLPEARRPRFGPDESQPISKTHVGRTREAIIGELGQPSSEWAGHYGLSPRSHLHNHKGARTLYYHWPSGAFYASVCEVEGEDIRFSSDWVPEGWVID